MPGPWINARFNDATHRWEFTRDAAGDETAAWINLVGEGDPANNLGSGVAPDGAVLMSNGMGGTVFGFPPTGSDNFVRITSADSLQDYLANKIVSGHGTNLAIQNPGSYETLAVDVQEAALDHNSLNNLLGGGGGEFYHLTQTEHTLILAGDGRVRTRSVDPLSGYLENKLDAGHGITLATLTGLNERVSIAVNETELSHNSLGELNGGTTGEFYHLTQAEHTRVANGDGRVRITTLDTTSNYLHSKVNAGHGIQLVTVSPGGNESLTIQVSEALLSHDSLGGIDAGTIQHLTTTEHNGLVAGIDAGSLHIHDARYYTRSQLASVATGSEGASLIGTTTFTNLGSAATVEAGLANVNQKNPPKRSGGSGNPNGIVTGIGGDVYVDTANGVVYMHIGAMASNNNWIVT